MRLIDRRLGLLFLCFVIALSLVAVRATWLSTVSAGSLKERAVTQQIEDITVPARRGTISDRNGVELAVSEDAVTVFANPFLIDDPAATAQQLSTLLGRTADELLETLADRDKGFVYLRRKLDPTLGARVEKLGIEGIGTLTEPKRTYPQGALAGQVLGTVGTDNYGLSGIEQQHEKTLHGSDGQRRLVKDALGEPISIIEPDRAEAGDDLELTLDVALQERVEAVMGELGKAHQPAGATAVVMDPRNGEVLALTNWPRVDPNDPAGAPEHAHRNLAVASSFEPGSTFKAFTVAGAVEEGVVSPSTELDLPPILQVSDRTIEDAHERGPVTLSTSQILAQSSNVGAAMIGQRLGPKRFDKWIRRFGFGRPTGVGLPGEEQGIVLRPEDYNGASLGNMSIGQGLAVTPMQMAAGFSAIANGGVLNRPHIVAGAGGEGRRVISRRTAESVSNMLEGVLSAGGTAEEASIEGYELAGKTGTAEKPDPVNGGYSEFKFFSSFIGFAPARNPRLMVAVMVDEPQGAYYGGEVAAPAFERILSFALPYLRIPPR